MAESHRHRCDIANPSSPQATVAMVRFEESHVDYLVLGDTFVVLDALHAGPHMITDSREVDVRSECSSPLGGLTVGTLEYERTLPSVIDALRARRNQSGGCWIAKDDPDAAVQAITGRVPLDALRGIALLSNGASRIVDPYRLLEWPAALELLRTSGPHEILRRVRGAETEGVARGSLPGAPVSDDATVAYCDLPY